MIRYRHAKYQDLWKIADIFAAAFPESIRHYAGHPVSPLIFVDAFAIGLDAEPGSLFIAETDNRIVGYVLGPAKFSNLARVAILRGHVCRMFWHWLTGQYMVGVRPVYMAVRNWLSLWKESSRSDEQTDARILSIAVDPNFQGRKIGAGLMGHALEYLRSRGVQIVRLEVRPNNLPAVHLYEKIGFRAKGSMRDTQGEWLIMLKSYQ